MLQSSHSLSFSSRLEKGVIVYICDSRGVRDIYDTDGSSVVAASEPLVVLVCFLISTSFNITKNLILKYEAH